MERARQQVLVATCCLLAFFPLPIFSIFSTAYLKGAPAAALFAVSLLSMAFFIFSIINLKLKGNTRLVLSEEGVSVPLSFFGQWTNQQENISWSSLNQISIKDSLDNKDLSQTGFIELHSGLRTLRLSLKGLAAEDLDKFVSACLLWSQKDSRDPTFLQLAQQVTNRSVDDSDSSFTGLWMKEASRRLRATPFSPLAPGSKLQQDRVEIVQAIAAGGWSAVYLCQWQGKTGVILKEAVVPPAVDEKIKSKAYEQFQREAQILSALDHPQIAKVLDYFVENGRQYMILQRIAGPNLRTYIKDKGPVSERQALKWANELRAILTYLHKREPPVIHRDLTPENLILDMKGSVVLVDFGSANEFLGTVTGTLVGKPSYVSPEQFSGHARAQSDLYSLGAVLAFLLTGSDPEPLTEAKPQEVNAEISEETDLLIADLMRLDLSDRVKDVDELAIRLSALYKNKV